jgi:hypothetical protein
MATEREFDLLDDYVANRLGGDEKSAFEKVLQADPELQREHVMQQKLVKAIKDARVNELKSFLNNVQVPPVNHGGTSVVAKFAAGTLVAGLVATGVYFYFDKPEETVPVEQTLAPAEEEKEETAKREDGNVPAEASSEENITATSKSEEASSSERPESKPSINAYDPSTEEESSVDIEEPAADRRSGSRAGAPTIAVHIDKQNKKYDFNYQFKDGKLTLFGPFEKNLYEIMEFFSDEKRTVFLYYKNNYYLLKENNEEVNELKVVTDQALIKKLKEYRGN